LAAAAMSDQRRSAVKAGIRHYRSPSDSPDRHNPDRQGLQHRLDIRS
jgi:hypothetical protein